MSREFETKPDPIEALLFLLPLTLVSFPFLSLFTFLLPFLPPNPNWSTNCKAGKNTSMSSVRTVVGMELCQWSWATFRLWVSEQLKVKTATWVRPQRHSLFPSPYLIKLQSCFSSTQRIPGLWTSPDVHGMNKALNLYLIHWNNFLLIKGVVIIN